MNSQSIQEDKIKPVQRKEDSTTKIKKEEQNIKKIELRREKQRKIDERREKQRKIDERREQRKDEQRREEQRKGEERREEESREEQIRGKQRREERRREEENMEIRKVVPGMEHSVEPKTEPGMKAPLSPPHFVIGLSSSESSTEDEPDGLHHAEREALARLRSTRVERMRNLPLEEEHEVSSEEVC